MGSLNFTSTNKTLFENETGIIEEIYHFVITRVSIVEEIVLPIRIVE